MKLLVIGGGRFVGAHLVDAALARGHELTLFNRGRASAPPPGARALTGDRRADLSALTGSGERWDAVVDTCGYLPREVAAMADALRGRVRHYCFVSSVSVYASFAAPNREDAPVGTIDDPDTEVVDGRTYGPLKALCEAALRARWPAADTLVVRPGLVVGPRDPTQRFTWWPARIARAAAGEPVLVPGEADDPVQCIDARDLAAFMLDAVEAGLAGTFNAVAPPGVWTMVELLSTCAEVAGTQPQFRRAEAAAVERLGLRPWVDLPVWLPPQGEYQHFMRTPVDAALAAGLRCRPLAQTVADTLAWHRALPEAERAFTLAGLDPAREAAALAAL